MSAAVMLTATLPCFMLSDIVSGVSGATEHVQNIPPDATLQRRQSWISHKISVSASNAAC